MTPCRYCGAPTKQWMKGTCTECFIRWKKRGTYTRKQPHPKRIATMGGPLD